MIIKMGFGKCCVCAARTGFMRCRGISVVIQFQNSTLYTVGEMSSCVRRPLPCHKSVLLNREVKSMKNWSKLAYHLISKCGKLFMSGLV